MRKQEEVQESMGYGMRFSGKFEKGKKKIKRGKDLCQPNGLEMSDLHVVFQKWSSSTSIRLAAIFVCDHTHGTKD